MSAKVRGVQIRQEQNSSNSSNMACPQTLSQPSLERESVSPAQFYLLFIQAQILISPKMKNAKVAHVVLYQSHICCREIKLRGVADQVICKEKNGRMQNDCNQVNTNKHPGRLIEIIAMWRYSFVKLSQKQQLITVPPSAFLGH